MNRFDILVDSILNEQYSIPYKPYWTKTTESILMTESVNCKLVMQPSNIHGMGLFADQEIAEGEEIGCTGEYVNDRYISTELGKYHNHSEQCNCKSEKRDNKRYLIAIAPISKGEELTVDYTAQPDLEQPLDGWCG